MSPDTWSGLPSSHAGSDELPPCDLRVQPYEKDQRILWAFRCAAILSLTQGEAQAANELIQRLDKWTYGDALAFGLAFQIGAVSGSAQALSRYYQDQVAIVRGALQLAAQLYDVTYDPQMYSYMSDFYSAPPGSTKQAESLDTLSGYLEQEYPGLAEAFRTLAMATVALEALAKWIQTDIDAPMKIAMAISTALGRALGEEAATLLPLSGSPEALGTELGQLSGVASVEVALLILGF